MNIIIPNYFFNDINDPNIPMKDIYSFFDYLELELNDSFKKGGITDKKCFTRGINNSLK